VTIDLRSTGDGRSASSRAEDDWTAQTRHDGDAWFDLAGEWDDLYARSSRATPFQAHAWLESWWRRYGRPGRLVLVLVRHRGRLVGAGAWVRGRRWGLPVLVPVGCPISDFSDVLLDDEDEQPAAAALAAELARVAGRSVIDVPEVPASAALWAVVAAWPGRHWHRDGALCLEIAARPLPDLLAALPGKTARRARKKQRAIDAAGIDVHWCDADEAPASIAAMLALHRVQWRGRAMTPEHRRPRFAEHLAAAVTVMIGRGQAALAEYRMGGHLVAVDVLLVGRGMVGGYLYGIHPDLRRRVDVAQLMVTQDLDLACRLGVPTLSFMRGDEPHKRVWGPMERPNQRVLLGGPRAGWARPYAAAVLVRTRTAELVRRRLPPLRRLIARGRAWRPFST
jgi:CelD/BcsL family acetyltransferase involved in cellulose biosynthesis